MVCGGHCTVGFPAVALDQRPRRAKLAGRSLPGGIFDFFPPPLLHPYGSRITEKRFVGNSTAVVVGVLLWIDGVFCHLSPVHVA